MKIQLTRAQLDELKRLAREPQPSYGKGRVRVHNNLRRHGLVTIDHDDGFVCTIAQAGRDFLATKTIDTETTGVAPFGRAIARGRNRSIEVTMTKERTARVPDEPCLTWEKQSYKRYAAILPGANARLEVVRSGVAKFMNERWHPVVFGNRWAGPSDGFATVSEAMVCAETTAAAYARVTLEALR